jgi:hypothetical protein
MGVLHDRMATDLRLRGMSPVTPRMYLRCARAFAAYHHRSPAALGEAEVRAFLAEGLRRQPSPPRSVGRHTVNGM